MKNIFASFIAAVDTEYDRRIRAASNVREYQIGGHGHGHDHDHDDQAHHDDHTEHDHHDAHHAADVAHDDAPTQPATH